MEQLDKKKESEYIIAFYTLIFLVVLLAYVGISRFLI